MVAMASMPLEPKCCPCHRNTASNGTNCFCDAASRASNAAKCFWGDVASMRHCHQSHRAQMPHLLQKHHPSMLPFLDVASKEATNGTGWLFFFEMQHKRRQHHHWLPLEMQSQTKPCHRLIVFWMLHQRPLTLQVDMFLEDVASTKAKLPMPVEMMSYFINAAGRLFLLETWH